MSDDELLAELAGGFVIQTNDEGYGYSYRLVRYGPEVNSGQLNRLIDRGWLESGNTTYRISDEGKKVYLKSTDELRD